MMLCTQFVFLALITVVLATINDREPKLNQIDDYELVQDGERTSFVLKNERRRLLASYDKNKVELYVMSDPSLTKRFTDDYGSSRTYEKIKAFVLELVDGASEIYEKKNWGPAGSISLHLVELEVAKSYSGAYSGLYPNFSYDDGKEYFYPPRRNCKDPLKYGTWSEGGCYITGSSGNGATAANRQKSMIYKFKGFISKYKRYKKFDNHVLLVGNKMAGIAGVAFRGGMCKTDGNIAIINAKYNVLLSDQKTLAHELGHNFGMLHNTAVRKGSVMGGWTSWDGQPSFQQKAYENLNARFKESDKLSCLRNGVRSFRKGYTSGGSSYFKSEDDTRCATHNTYGDAVIVSGALWEDSDSKTFTVKTDECANSQPIFQHIVNDNTTYKIYYDPYPDTVDSDDVKGHWILTMYQYAEAKCDEEDLLDCVRGKWQQFVSSNDSVEIVTDETLFVEQSLSAKEANEGNSAVQSAFFWVATVLIVVVLVLFAVFMWRRKTVNKAKIVIDEESEEEEEEAVEVQLDGLDVEETNLTQTAA